MEVYRKRCEFYITKIDESGVKGFWNTKESVSILKDFDQWFERTFFEAKAKLYGYKLDFEKRLPKLPTFGESLDFRE